MVNIACCLANAQIICERAEDALQLTSDRLLNPDGAAGSGLCTLQQEVSISRKNRNSHSF